MVRKLEPLCDKIGYARVEAVVHDFYQRLRADPELGPYFTGIPDKAAHEEKVIGYWWLAMGGRMQEPPFVDMIGAHQGLGITNRLLDRWLELFGATVDEHLEPELAAQWRQMATAVADKLRANVVRG
ncbi:globin [Thiohalorhabdus denitrificans]|uniref:Hemoglobin n=1 Tax=Thiohalorhabdus denitrificans TaxID=381306 RepID=A0A0P9CL24_9GAMM|nr:group III truncated hemoglobin [Thiohalorhabdus denitrificans]KPV39695.1 globin [Thiohalorhabdus denitrificans]SCX93648.1 hemoglobin [Thiohalorhabdus denitrificans]